MKTSKEGLVAINKSEGCKLKAYRDIKGVWTIGWGQTGEGIKEGVEWTQEQADAARDTRSGC